MRARQAQFQVSLDETEISGVAVETMNANDEVRPFRREEPVLIADMEVRQG